MSRVPAAPSCATPHFGQEKRSISGKRNLLLPDAGWGEPLFDQSCPSVGTVWSDRGTRREQRQLKHRAKGDTRSAPCPPELTQLLHDHLIEHGTDSEGRLFRGIRSRRGLEESTYHRAWRKARHAALTAEEYASPLARRPYDLRHAAVSKWLNAGYRQRRLLSGQGTVSRSCSRSTRSASLGRRL